jgi:DNA processing protein
MSVDPDLEGWLWLALIDGVGGQTLRRLLSAFGAPDQVRAARHAELAHVAGPILASAIKQGPDPKALDAALAWLGAAGNHLVTLADADYPKLLLQTADPPPLLFLKGRRDLLNRGALAIVGSRNATPAGIADTQAFARALSDAGLCIVSGLAVGIDAAAHRGALQGVSSSIAVVGTGLDIVYPARNRALAHQLAEQGTLISEFALGTPPLSGNFPRRNRIISGMCRGCLVVEAALSSGSLITARLAVEQGREVFALPGSIHSPLSKGCHALIKQGAKLVDDVRDILDELGMGTQPAAPSAPAAPLAPPLQGLLDQMGFEPCDLDTLCLRAGLTSAAATAMLLQLELDGVVGTLPGGRFQRLR